MIPRVDFAPSREAAEALAEALLGKQIAVGGASQAVREQLAALWDVRHVALTLNGFAALHAALEAVGVKGKRVLLPEVSSCFAPLNAVLAAGGVPAFRPVDDRGILVPDDADLEAGAAPAAALVPIHFTVPAALPDRLSVLSCPVVLDAALASLFPSEVRRLADRLSAPWTIALSFYPTKGIAGADGGSVLSNDDTLARRAASLIEYRSQSAYEGAPRFNYAMSNLQATVLQHELKRLPSTVSALDSIARIYAASINMDRELSLFGGTASAARTRYILGAPSAADVDALIEDLAADGIAAAREFVCMAPDRSAIDAASAHLVDATVSIPFHPLLTKTEAERIAVAVNRHVAGQ